MLFDMMIATDDLIMQTEHLLFPNNLFDNIFIIFFYNLNHIFTCDCIIVSITFAHNFRGEVNAEIMKNFLKGCRDEESALS